jgi:ATP-dependent DNA helicase RecQ
MLFYRPEDLGVRRFFAGTGNVDVEDIARVAEVVAEADGPVPPTDLQEATDLSQSKLTTAVSRLEDVGAVEVLPSGEIEAAGGHIDHDEVEQAAEAQSGREAFDRSRIEMIRAYAEQDTGCRRDFVLAYFGEAYEPPCGACDVCDAGGGDPGEDAPDGLELGTRVRHPEWGDGTVQAHRDGQLTVVFDTVGYKTLALDVVEERGLLEPAQ